MTTPEYARDRADLDALWDECFDHVRDGFWAVFDERASQIASKPSEGPNHPDIAVSASSRGVEAAGRQDETDQRGGEQ